jgi:hypothetical protein
MEPCHFAFTVMSFRPEMEPVFTQAIAPAVEHFSLECRRIDKTPFVTERITNRILSDIRDAYFIVAELSDERPNCYYELGFAHALGKPVILITDNSAKIPFDIKDFQFIVYSGLEELQSKLHECILETVLKNHDRESEDDARCGKFGRYAFRNGRLLTAILSPIKGKNLCDVQLVVSGTPGQPPLEGKARFYVHPTYENAMSRTVPVKKGVAKYKIENADEYFTVAAKVDDDKTELELNLRSIPGAFPSFYTTG